jgi:hypothetical protein
MIARRGLRGTKVIRQNAKVVDDEVVNAEVAMVILSKPPE